MIRYAEGNLLDASADALVNTVNEIGVMGKGVASMFREKYPASSQEYQRAARTGEVQVGRMYVTEGDSLVGPRWIVHFPTKKHWRHPSKFAWIRDGLRDLIRVGTAWPCSRLEFIGAASSPWPCRHWAAETGDSTGTWCGAR